MCLNSVTFALRKSNKRKERVGYGYKLVKIKDKNLYSTDKKSNKISKSLWMKAQSPTINANDTVEYDAGFHIFLNRRDAEDYKYYRDDKCIIRVKFCNVIAFGKQKLPNGSLADCVIADEMKFVEIVKVFGEYVIYVP